MVKISDKNDRIQDRINTLKRQLIALSTFNEQDDSPKALSARKAMEYTKTMLDSRILKVARDIQEAEDKCASAIAKVDAQILELTLTRTRLIETKDRKIDVLDNDTTVVHWRTDLTRRIDAMGGSTFKTKKQIETEAEIAHLEKELAYGKRSLSEVEENLAWLARSEDAFKREQEEMEQMRKQKLLDAEILEAKVMKQRDAQMAAGGGGPAPPPAPPQNVLVRTAVTAPSDSESANSSDSDFTKLVKEGERKVRKLQAIAKRNEEMEAQAEKEMMEDAKARLDAEAKRLSALESAERDDKKRRQLKDQRRSLRLEDFLNN